MLLVARCGGGPSRLLSLVTHFCHSSLPFRHSSPVTRHAFCLLAFSALLSAQSTWAEPGLTGQTGLIAMPDARVDPDGTWRTGYSMADPYRAIWVSLTAMPLL